MNLDTFEISKARFSLNTVSEWRPEAIERLKATAFTKVDELVALSTLRESPGFTLMSRVTTQAGPRFFALVVYDDDDGQGCIQYNEFSDTDAALRFARDIVNQHNGQPVAFSDPEAN